jgi:GDP-L-fucose synthase
MKKILITGANGFIGKSLVELLKDKYEVIPIVKSESTNLLSQWGVGVIFAKHKDIDFVIHCATVGGGKREDNPQVFADNVKMFENLIEHKDKYKMLITFGSGAEFGSTPHDAISSEVNQFFTMNYYGLSKKYITNKIRNERLNAISLRLFGCFGEHEESTRFIKNNIKRVKNKEQISINQNKWFDFFYVNDLVPIIENIMDNYETYKLYPWKDFNVCYDEKYTLRQIGEKITQMSGNEIKTIVEDREFGESYTGKSELNRLIKFNKSQLIGLDQGIKQMYEL